MQSFIASRQLGSPASRSAAAIARARSEAAALQARVAELEVLEVERSTPDAQHLRVAREANQRLQVQPGCW